MIGKDKLGINKITLTYNATTYCETGERINLNKMMLLIHKKYPEEMPLKLINEILMKEGNKPEQLLIEFLNKFHRKSKYAYTCKWFNTYYEVLFDDIKLKYIGHIYGFEY